MCGPHRRFAPLLPRTLRRIPQAVCTVATSEKGSLAMANLMFQYRKRSKHAPIRFIMPTNLGKY